MRSAWLLAAAAIFSWGCSSAPSPAPTSPQPPQTAPQAAQNAPAAPEPTSGPKHITIDQAVTTLGTLGYYLSNRAPVDKADCRTDEGCIQGVMAEYADGALMLLEFDESNPKGTAFVDYYKLKDPKTSDGSLFEINGTPASLIVVGNLVVTWRKRVSYEEEEKVRAALTQLL